MKYKTALFDLDGTLTDPKVGITKSVQYALNQFGIYVEDLESLATFIGPPLAKSFQDAFGLSEKDSMKAIEYYREYFAKSGIFENKIYDGIEALLNHMKASGIGLMLATSKPTQFALQILAYFQLSKYFDDVVGSNLDGTMSEKADIIEALIQKHHLDRSSSVMIGDRKHDIIGANHCGIDSIGVSYGYGSISELDAESPTRIVNSIEELKNSLLINNIG